MPLAGHCAARQTTLSLMNSYIIYIITNTTSTNEYKKKTNKYKEPNFCQCHLLVGTALRGKQHCLS